MFATSTALLFLMLGELPLPDATLFGTITTEAGQPVVNGALRVQVLRDQTVILEVQGTFTEDDKTVYYSANIPLETAIGAPGPSGVGAREGDVVGAILLDGKPLKLKLTPPPLAAGVVTRVDGTSGGGPPEVRFSRGDCSPDLAVDLSDAVRVLGYLFLGGGEPSCLDACDGDSSGSIDLTDAVYILGFLFLGGPAPLAPGPSCGIDDTPSGLGCVESLCTV